MLSLSEWITFSFSWAVHCNLFPEVVSTDDVISISKFVGRSLLSIWVTVLSFESIGLDSLSELFTITIAFSKSVSMLSLGEWIAFSFSWAVHCDLLTEVVSTYNVISIGKFVARFLLNIRVSVLLLQSVGLDGFSELFAITITLSKSVLVLSLGIVVLFCSGRAIHGDSITESVSTNDVLSISKFVSMLSLSEWITFSFSRAVHSNLFTEVISTDDVVSISEFVAGSLLDEWVRLSLSVWVWFSFGWTVHGDLISKVISSDNIVSIGESIGSSLLSIGVWLSLCWTVHGDGISEVITTNDVESISEFGLLLVKLTKVSCLSASKEECHYGSRLLNVHY
jgi:hypothetical protein